MFLPQNLLSNRQCAVVEPFGLRVLTQLIIGFRKIVQTRRQTLVVRAELLGNLDRRRKELLGFGVAPGPIGFHAGVMVGLPSRLLSDGGRDSSKQNAHRCRTYCPVQPAHGESPPPQGYQ